MSNPPEITDALSAPLGDLIASVGRGVAHAQHAMDQATIDSMKDIYGTGGNQLLAAIGYRPTWYKIPEVTANLSISLTVGGQGSNTGTSSLSLYAAPVDANFKNQYDYDIQAASNISFKIVPVPPSPQTENLEAVPQLTGLTFGEARALLTAANLAYKVDGYENDPAENALIRETLPEAGVLVAPDQNVEIFIQ